MTVLDWSCEVLSVTDGDTIRVRLTRKDLMVPGWVQTTSTAGEHGVALRLVTVDTPERGQAGYQQAKAALAWWLAEAKMEGGGLRCTTYDSGGWDRLLADVYTVSDRGNTASQFMLRNGWLPYVHGT